MSKKDIRDSLTDDARGSGGGFVPGNAITPMVDLGGSARPENVAPARAKVTESLEYPAYNWAPSAFQRGQYNSEYADLIKAASDRIANWNYDPKNDVSYRAYAQQYMRNGANAYEDTLARQATRTGGVASSYAAAAAQQQYNNYMADLASKVPELEQLAYQKAMNNLNMYTGLDETAYNRWQNDEQMRYNDWARLQSAAQSAYNQRYNAELNKYKADLESAATDASTADADAYKKRLEELVEQNVITADEALEKWYSYRDPEYLTTEMQKTKAARDAYSAAIERAEKGTEFDNALDMINRRSPAEASKWLDDQYKSGKISSTTYNTLKKRIFNKF